MPSSTPSACCKIGVPFLNASTVYGETSEVFRYSWHITLSARSSANVSVDGQPVLAKDSSTNITIHAFDGLEVKRQTNDNHTDVIDSRKPKPADYVMV